MESRRTWRTFAVTTALGVAASGGLLLGGQRLLELGWPGLDLHVDPLVFGLVGLQGLLLGVLLAWLVPGFPALQGLLASAVVPLHALALQGWVLDLDGAVELLLRFEAHFAGLYLAAFAVFLARGGGVAFPMFVGLRYLRFKMITGISVVGVGLGVAALMVVLSVMSGFETDLKSKIIGTNAHAILQRRGGEFVDWPRVLEGVGRVDGVVAASPFVYNEVMVTSEFNLSGVFLKGIEPSTASAVTELRLDEGSLELLLHPERIEAQLERLRAPPRPAAPDPSERPPLRPGEGGEPADDILPGVPPSDPDSGEVPLPAPLRLGEKKSVTPGILIGRELKKILKVRLGDRVNVVSPLSEELGPSGPVPKARAFRVAGVFYTGMYEYDAKSVYLTLEAAQRYFGMGQAITGIALKLRDIDRAGPICEEIVRRLGGHPYYSRTWYEMNRSLFSALKMEKVGMFILLIIVILVSAFGIVSTLVMLVWEKVKEIAILRSMGATGDGVMKVFMAEGITIALVGTALGMAVGWLGCLWLQGYGLQLDPEVYYIEKMPVNIDPLEFVLIAGIALHISFIATIYPSRRASRLRPVEGLRYD